MKQREYKKIQEFARNYYIDPSTYIFKISEEQQQNELHKLKLGLREEQFFVVVDLLNFTIIDFGGVESLGFDPKTFTLKNYFDMVDPQGVMPMLTALGKQTFLIFKLPKYQSF